MRLFVFLAVVLLVPACGDGGGGGGGGSAVAATLLAGGNVSSGTGVTATLGGDAGGFDVRSTGPIRFGENPAPAPPTLPAVPSGGTPLTSLSQDVTELSPLVVISGTVTASGIAARSVRSRPATS